MKAGDVYVYRSVTGGHEVTWTRDAVGVWRADDGRNVLATDEDVARERAAEAEEGQDGGETELRMDHPPGGERGEPGGLSELVARGSICAAVSAEGRHGADSGQPGGQGSGGPAAVRSGPHRYKLTFDPGVRTGAKVVWRKTAEELLRPNGIQGSLLDYMLREAEKRGTVIRLEPVDEC